MLRQTALDSSPVPSLEDQDVRLFFCFFSFLRNRLRTAHRKGVKAKPNPMKTDGSFHGPASSLPCEIPLLHPARHMTVCVCLRDGC